MVSTFIGLLDIQSWWEIPCIAHFCSLFSSAFDLPDIDIEDLESALLTDGTEEAIGLLPELIVSLLKGCDDLNNRREITTSNYQMFLRRFLRQQCRIYNTENYFDTDIDFQALPLRNKLLILHSLCHFRLDSKDVQIILSNLEADSLRVEPLGYDSKNSGYWYFYGTRLYREDTKNGGKSTIWQVICFTEEDWQNLATKFQNSSSPKERALFNILAENFLPKLPQLFRERERLRRRKLLQVRNSARIRNLLEEKQRIIEKQETEQLELERKKLEEFKLEEAANKNKAQSRRRSRSSSTGSGISTYASSLKTSNNSSEYLNQREKFCLTPEKDQQSSNDSEEEQNKKNQITFEQNKINYNIRDKRKFKKIKKNKLTKEAVSKLNECLKSPISQENKENCCKKESYIDSDKSYIESNSEEIKLEMAPATNTKLPGRQTNNSLSSLGANVFIPSKVLGNKTDSFSKETNSGNAKTKQKITSCSSNTDVLAQRKNETTNSDILPEFDEVLQIKMYKVIFFVKNHRDAWPFVDPVEEDIAPNYYSIIRRPMDLLKMEEKLDEGEYKSFDGFQNDFKLIVNNCRLYNGNINEYTQMVNNLEEAFENATEKYIENDSSDDEGNSEYLGKKMTIFRQNCIKKLTALKAKEEKEVTKNLKDKRETITKKLDETIVKIIEKQKESETINSKSLKRKRKDKDKRRKKKLKANITINIPTDNESNDDENSLQSIKEQNLSNQMSEDENNYEQNNQQKNDNKFLNKKLKNKTNDKKKANKQKDNNVIDKIECSKKTRTLKHTKGKKKNLSESENESEKCLKESNKKINTSNKSDKLSSNKNSINSPIKNKTISKRISSQQTLIKGKKIANKSCIDDDSTKKLKNEKKESNINEKPMPSRKGKNLKKPVLSTKKQRKGKIKNLNNSIVKNENLSKEIDNETITSIACETDLHKKYAKSALIKADDLMIPEKNIKALPSTKVGKKRKTNEKEDDLMSVSSQEQLHNSSPYNSDTSDTKEINETNKKSKQNNKAKSKTKNQPLEESLSSHQIEPKTQLFYDKYDLIKQRRNRNTEEKCNQILKEAKELKDNKTKVKQNMNSPIHSKEKNQKLKETIEKLKVKNAKSKERSVLIDEIFGVKPTQEIRDEKTIFEKLRETCLDKSPEMLKSNTKTNDSSSNTSKNTQIKSQKIVNVSNEDVSISTKKLNTNKKPANNINIIKKKPNETNYVALELETEQTLKDINRWLEHTPRFSEFSSASNSPSRYNLLEDFDAVASKLDPADFRRPVPIATPKTIDSISKYTDPFDELAAQQQKVDIVKDLLPTTISTGSVTSIADTTNVNSTKAQKVKENTTTNTIQFLSHPPPAPPQFKAQQHKENKRKSLKDKLSNNNRRKDILRTIERLQPGKLKGNLIGNIQNNNKQEETSHNHSLKTKDVKNILTIDPDESAPKLSLGTVLNTEGFGLTQLHNFGEEECEGELKVNDNIPVKSENLSENNTQIREFSSIYDEGISSPKETNLESKNDVKNEKLSATPNLSAWFKAFGAPKKAKKLDEDEKKIENNDSQQQIQDKINDQTISGNQSVLKSPSASDNFPLPAPRQRKASTGSTISERSSFSQDPDSPRVGIDDRFGAYSGPYPSPIGASPIMVSPKQDEIIKPTSPYQLNGAIKVGFYQDTITKNSPEKSCSPRQMPSPYQQYSHHIYSSASSPTINNDIVNTYTGCYNNNNNNNNNNNSTNETNKPVVYSNTSPAPIFEQYKQPRSHESDYNSSMSPSTNPNSPYQQSQNSPYHQHQHSPYQQTQQQPHSPYQHHITQSQSVGSPNDQNSSYQPPNSPYQQQTNSPYQQNPTSPYQQQQQGLGFNQQQTTTNQQCKNNQQQINETFTQQNTNQFNVNNNNTQQQYSQHNPNHINTYNHEIPKVTTSTDLVNKIHTSNDWTNTMDMTLSSNNLQPQATSGRVSNLNPLPQTISNLSIQSDQNLPYESFPQNNEKSSNLYTNDISMNILQRQVSHEITKNQSSHSTKISQEIDVENNVNKVQSQSEDTTLNKQQQMFDSFLGSVSSAKNSNYIKPIDISTSKAFEMFNRAATMGFPKEFPNTLMINKNQTENLSITQPQEELTQPTYQQLETRKNPERNLHNNNSTNKPTNLSNNFNQQIPLSQNNDSKLQTFQTTDVNKSSLHQDTNLYGQTHKQHTPTNIYSSNIQDKLSNESLLLNTRNQHLNMDLTNFKTAYNNPAAVLDPLRNFNPLTMLDETMLGLQNPTQSGFYEKNITAAHLFSKNIGAAVYQNPTYNARDQTNTPTSYITPTPINVSNSQTIDIIETKPKRGRKRNKTTPQTTTTSSSSSSSSLELANNVNQNTLLAVQQQQQRQLSTSLLPPQVHQSNQQNQTNIQNTQQGFQLYSGLKTNITTSTSNSSNDPSGMALKTPTTMVPGSAFNFGPTGLGPPPGIYADNSSYLDEFRTTANPYYLPSGHRTTTEASDKTVNTTVSPATAASTYHQFLTHQPPRSAYPFVNTPQLDPNSPIYQQYIQRQEELRARMMINQGLLSSAPGGYPHQPSYRPPLGMPKHYEHINRQPWF